MASVRLFLLPKCPSSVGGIVTSKTAVKRILLPSLANQRDLSSETKVGAGGRSSFSGIVATVFGATGFIGRYIVNRLGRVGSQVVVPFRGDEHDYRHLRLMGDLGQITFLTYNLKDPASILKVVKHSSVVINLVGRDYETRNFKYHDVHVDGARVIAEASRAAGVKRLIHFSALNADANSPSRFLQSKALGEEVVREAFPEATIVRPSNTFGPEDRFFNYYARLRAVPFGLIPVFDRGTETYKMPLYVGDIASGVVNIISDPMTAGKTYEFVGPRSYQLHDLVQYLYAVMYRPCNIISPPKSLARFVAYLLEQSPFIPYMTRDVLLRHHLSNRPTLGLPGLEDLGVTPQSVETKALAMLRRYRNFLDFNKPIDDIQPTTSSSQPK